jgi:ribosomal protein S27AE
VANGLRWFYNPAVATKTTDNFKCPKCGSGRTKPLSIAIAGGTRRRSTVGISRRSVWGSSSTYKSDLVSSLPQRPSNAGAYVLVFLGVCGLLFALFVGSSDKNATGIAVGIGVISVVFLVAGIGAKKSPEHLSTAQASWDRRWMCARCGNQWEVG